jgi:hypothetical protein
MDLKEFDKLLEHSLAFSEPEKRGIRAMWPNLKAETRNEIFRALQAEIVEREKIRNERDSALLDIIEKPE